jgi:hypothetical protein
VPDRADLAARDAAAAALGGDASGLGRALAGIEGIEGERRAAGEPGTGLVPYALDLGAALETDPRERARAVRELLDRDDLDAPLRARLEAEADDDELALARQRDADARWLRLGRVVNSLVEPMGRSLLGGALLPLRLLRSFLGLALDLHQEEALTTPERQALALRKQFLEEQPGAPEAPALAERVEADQGRWYRTLRDQQLRRARAALEAGDPAAALLSAERALLYAPEDAAAGRVAAQARAALERERARLREALSAAPEAELGAGTALSRALLGAGDVALEAERLRASAPRGPLADEAGFASALALAQAGRELDAWRAFETVARRSGAGSNMARHAWAELASPQQDPERAFRAARAEERGLELRWLLFGPLAGGPRERDLPVVLEWLVELPALPGVALGLPARLLRWPWSRPDGERPAVFARRYLDRYPDGAHAAELREWLVAHEARRKDWIAAAALAAEAPDADLAELARLRGRAAEQALRAARAARRRDVRAALLRRTASEYPDTAAGREAGRALRELVAEATPQRIRISRGFLLENPELAGPEALALRPGLLDGEPANGELHPEGVTLLGGRVLELALVDGDESDPPSRQRRRVSPARLARSVARLEEAALRMARTDPDAPLEPDADRDLFFERALLGLADPPDPRATAESSYAFLGARERYGLVRAREPLLPVDLVLQLSGSDLALGAFPRLRPPRETPDAVLYK